MSSMDYESLMEFLFQDRVSNLPVDALAEVFDRLIWCAADNGQQISLVRESWLEGDCFEKCSIALSMNEVFPYDDPERMKEIFVSISDKWPPLKKRCDEIIDSRDRQNV